MAEVRLADVIEPRVFEQYVSQRTTEKTEIFTSGLVRQDAMLSNKLSGGGRTFDMPAWDDLDNTEPDAATDDPANLGTPGKIGTYGDVARRQTMARSWATMNLASELAGDNAMQEIGNKVAAYWARAWQRRTIATLQGVFADNIANNAGDLVHAPAATAISGNVVLDGKNKLDDTADRLSLIIMHSHPYTRLQQQQLITFIPEHRGEVGFATYLGYRVIVDRNVPGAGGGAGTYTTWLTAPGILSFGMGTVMRAVHVEYVPAAGNNSGQEILFNRKEVALHPRGIRWNDAAITGPDGVMPVVADLANAANWTRVVPEKYHFPCIQLDTVET